MFCLPRATWGLVLVLSAGLASAQFPDLTVTRIDIAPPNPAPGETVVVTVTARNIGTAIPASETWMHLFLDSATTPQACQYDLAQDLQIAFPPGTDRLFTFEIMYPATGTYTLWAWVDGCESIIAESDETNNTLSRAIGVARGDLEILGIAPSVPDPQVGQAFSISVLVANNGPSLAANAWSLGLNFDDEPLTCAFDATQGPFLGLPANSSASVSFGPFVLETEGPRTLWAWVDCINAVPESDESNNKFAGEVVIGQPDLVIDSITPSVTTPIVGQSIDVTVAIRNAGVRDTVSFQVGMITDSANDPGILACELGALEYVPGLVAGATHQVVFPVTYNDARAHRLWAVVDACNGEPESDESNNAASLDINVGGAGNGPDLVVEAIDIGEIPTPEWGAVVVFDVTVRNVGNQHTGPFRIGDFALSTFPGTYPSYVVIGSPGPRSGGSVASVSDWNSCPWRTREVSNLAPGAATTVQFWRHFPSSGGYSFSASADACGTGNRAVAERSETNNTLTVEFEVFACDADADNDGVCDADDLCPNTYDPDNRDTDNDGMGDVCDADDDNDGVDDGADCEPRNRFVFPGATEICTDGIDNDCDGDVDEGARTLYRDADGDGYGDAGETIVDCGAQGYVTNPDDCDDSDPAVYPGANGPCDDGLDNDCDGTVDNERTVWGRDADADGFTDPADEITDDGSCTTPPEGYSLRSATPDPDDADFMVPEPVTAAPARIDISTPRTRTPDVVELVLERNGPEPFEYALGVVYGGSTGDWLTLDRTSGTATAGRVRLLLTPQPLRLARARYTARIQVTINGGPAFDVPVAMEVRHPRLTIRHSGQGGGAVTAEYDPDPNDAASEYEIVQLFDTTQGSFEGYVSVPDGRSAFVRVFTEGDCSNLVGLFDAQTGERLNDPNWFYWADPNKGCPGGSCYVHPIWVRLDGDRELVADFQLSGLACTACGPTALGIAWLSLIGRIRRRGH